MSKRYKITTGWQTSDRYRFDSDGETVTLVREYADIKDTQGGYEYSQGAWRVKATYASGRSHTRARTFYGELAWNSSQRLFDDVILAQRFGQ